MTNIELKKLSENPIKLTVLPYQGETAGGSLTSYEGPKKTSRASEIALSEYYYHGPKITARAPF